MTVFGQEVLFPRVSPPDEPSLKCVNTAVRENAVPSDVMPAGT